MRWLLVTGILILSSFLPMATHAEDENIFEKGYFDRNGDGLDDRMDVLIEKNENIGVIVIFHMKPTAEHLKQIENITSSDRIGPKPKLFLVNGDFENLDLLVFAPTKIWKT